MADLMTQATSYSQLVKKYSNFMCPVMKIKIGGSDITKNKKIKISNVEISMSLTESSSLSFTVEGVYNVETHSFSSDVSKFVKLGKSIKVELGYGSSTTEVFSGYIANVNMTFSDVPSINVVALDVTRLMMENVRANLRFNDKSYSEVFQEVMKKYSNVYTKLEVESTSDKIEEIVQMGSDYDFVKKYLCRRANKEFVYLAGKVYFRTPQKNSTPILTLEWGKGLMSFSLATKYCDKEIIVQGLNKKKEIISAKQKAKADSSSASATSSPIIYEVFKPKINDAEKAKLAAKSQAREFLQGCQKGNGSCIGLPELVPGRYIKLAKLDPSIDRKVYLEKVSHSFGDDGFTTSFEIGGW